MKRRINIAVVPPVLLPNTLVHVATEYKISKDILFLEDKLLVNELSYTNLYEMKFTLDLKDDDAFYVVTRYQYRVLDENGVEVSDVDGNPVFKFGTPSMITPFKGNQEGVTISDTIVRTPKIKIEEDFTYSSGGNIKIVSSDFDMFSSIGIHIATSYVITNLEGKVLLKREMDYENLTSFTLPDEFSLKDNLIFYVSHHTDTNADSNYGVYVNMVTLKLPKYAVDMYGDLWVGIDAQFRIRLINALYSNCKMDVILDNNIINTYNNIRDYAFIPTGDFIVGKVYTFRFTITSSNDIEYNYDITKIARAYKDGFKEKDYLDRYDYSGMIITNGLTKTLSYQLANNAILLFKNNTKSISLAKYLNTRENNNLQILGDLFSLPVVKNIIDPSTFIKELLNGDVVISYISRDVADFGTIYINTYEHNFFNNNFRLKNSIPILEKIDLVMPGSIITAKNYVYYISYGDISNRLIKMDPYTGIKEEILLPINAKRGISLTADIFGNVYLMGGTNDDTNNFTYYHVRSNDKLFKLNSDNTFTEIGVDLLKDVNKYIFQFHAAPRYGDKETKPIGFTLFQTIDNANYDVINDQSTYVVDIEKMTVVKKVNNHLDNLTYGNTIILNNGDVVKYSTTEDGGQKVYTYISDGKDEGDMDDEGNITRDGNTLTIEDKVVTTKFDLCRYDSVTIKPGGTLIIVSGDGEEVCYSDTLIVTRNMVLNKVTEFDDKGYSNIVMACPQAELILK